MFAAASTVGTRGTGFLDTATASTDLGHAVVPHHYYEGAFHG
ncbi:MAG: hypothetical protein WCJ04_01440 [Actinomycetes bacterium]